MTLTAETRRLLLVAHVVFSVGWIGALAAFLVLSLAGLISEDVAVVRSAYMSMDLINRFVIVPSAILALLTGIVQSLGTPWGLVRHYWVLFKLLIIVTATFMLLVKSDQISAIASIAGETSLTAADLRELRLSISVHAMGGLAVLLWALGLGMFKPKGLIWFRGRLD